MRGMLERPSGFYANLGPLARQFSSAGATEMSYGERRSQRK
jgi:hypothetical protein